MVSYSTGSMNSLVDKLTKLKNTPVVIQGLKQELVNLQEDFLHKVSRRREMNLQVEAWMKLVRELVFDIEDWIDQKPAMTDMEDLEEEIDRFKARIEHARELCERYNLVLEAPTYPRNPSVLSGKVAIESPLLYEKKTRLYALQDPTDELVKHLTSDHEKMLKVVSIVGVEGLGKTTLAKEIYAKIQPQGQFDCHAFVTLGRRPLSMRATLMEILRQVKLSQKKKVKPKSSTMRGGRRKPQQDLQKVISELWEYLASERYFILLDGIWSTRAWKIINCALPNEKRGSRVLTTTCISDVAECCSVHPSDVYWMKALSKMNCRSLYQELIRQEERPAEYDEVTMNMVDVCGGIPLAVTVTAGLFGMKCEELAELEKMFGKSDNLSSLEQYSASERMIKILNMSYAALSQPLKSCLLYLSVFREDYTIKKDRLIRLWVAEGFIPRKQQETRGGETRDEETGRGEETKNQETRDEDTRGEEKTEEKTTRGEIIRDEESLWQTGERYFNELITRRLIQPVFDYSDDQPVGCTIHGAILHFIKSLSSKGNFVTEGGADLSSRGSTDKVRRLMLDCYNDEDEDGDGTLASIQAHLSRVRSITIMGAIEGMADRSALTVSGKVKGMPVLPTFKLIRMLDLEDTDNLKSQHLRGIGGLVLLKHLAVAGTDIDMLPEEIGELEQLETLDLRRTNLTILPASIGKQKSLAHLLIDPAVELPKEILEMKALEEVSTIGIDSSRGSIDLVVKLLKKSQQLSVLGVSLDGSHLSSDNKSVRSFLGHAKGLFEQVASSTGLRSLSLSLDYLHGDLLGLLLESPPFDQLRRFKLTISPPVLKGTAQKLASLVSVTHMDIAIAELDDAVICVLGELPNLVLLKLLSVVIVSSASKKGMNSRCTVGVDHGFKRLKVFSLKCIFRGTELKFTEGAMPELQRLSLGLIAQETLSLYGNFSFGIEHLSSLTRVHVTINCKSATPSEVKSAEDAIKEQLAPIVFSTLNQDLMQTDHKASRTTLKVEDAITPQEVIFSVERMAEFSTTNQHLMLPDKAKKSTSTKIWVNGGKVKSLILLLATLAATITYQAGLHPPGGVWQDDRDGHHAGFPILLSTQPSRYKVFLYCNSCAFVLSMVAILIMLMVKEENIRITLLVSMILDMVALMGAYVAGSRRDARSSIYVVAMACGVIVYVLIHLLCTTELMKKRHNWLLLVATLIAAGTYQAGLNPPGDFRGHQDDGPAAGDPVLKQKDGHRFRAFFYCNTVSFMATMALVLFFTGTNLYTRAIRCYTLYGCIVMALVCLVAVYAGGIVKRVHASTYVFVLLAMVVSVVGVHTIQSLAFLLKKEVEAEVEEDDEDGCSAVFGHAHQPRSRPRPGHIPRPRLGLGSAQETKYRQVYASHIYLMFIGILAAVSTYQAGLNNPLDRIWQENGNHMVAATSSVLYDRYWDDRYSRRYLAFFYTNSTAFLASVIVITLQLQQILPWGHQNKNSKLLEFATNMTLILVLLCLMSAYTAGVARGWQDAIALFVLVLFCVAINAAPWIRGTLYSWMHHCKATAGTILACTT